MCSRCHHFEADVSGGRPLGMIPKGIRIELRKNRVLFSMTQTNALKATTGGSRENRCLTNVHRGGVPECNCLIIPIDQIRTVTQHFFVFSRGRLLVLGETKLFEIPVTDVPFDWSTGGSRDAGRGNQSLDQLAGLRMPLKRGFTNPLQDLEHLAVRPIVINYHVFIQRHRVFSLHPSSEPDMRRGQTGDAS
jgi:hypothetical protein